MSDISKPTTFVLLHGSWLGAWCWQRVADRWRPQEHRVTTPNQTSVGERSHLISASITLDTFVEDVVNHIRHEELEDIIFAGHSLGGIPMPALQIASPNVFATWFRYRSQPDDHGTGGIDRHAAGHWGRILC